MTTAMTYNRSSTRRLLAISLVALAFTGLLSPGSFATVSAISGLPGDSSHTAASIETLVPMPVHAETTRNITDAMASRHYVSTTLDDALSTKIYAAYLEDLDPSKSYFLASDIAEFDSLRLQLDDALSRGDVTPCLQDF